MARLTLVRHGQAAFLTEDYDRLSPLGKRQLRYLGDYWIGLETPVDRIAAGTLKRHRQSAEALAESYAAAGRPLPAIETVPGLDEFPWDAMLAHATSVLAEEYAEIRTLHRAFVGASVPRERHRTFQQFMEAVTLMWAHGQFETPDVETFEAFAARVNAALDLLCHEAQSGQHIVAITSGGPAAVAVQRALAVPPGRTLDLVWTLRNGGLVEFLFRTGRFSLSAFNAVPHLGTPDLWTYR
jgi:broad specificity phosphatase PhoE